MGLEAKQPKASTRISFNGKHNRRKAEILLFLYDLGLRSDQTDTITAKDLAMVGSWDLSDIRPFFTRWTRWGYLTREHVDPGRHDGSLYGYHLAAKGERFLALLPKWLPIVIQTKAAHRS